jgi:hypothetical protein
MWMPVQLLSFLPHISKNPNKHPCRCKYHFMAQRFSLQGNMKGDFLRGSLLIDKGQLYFD